MAQSVKVNYILNLINSGTQMLFPLITFPYVCRVIEADGVGQVNFFQSIISYISLFNSLIVLAKDVLMPFCCVLICILVHRLILKILPSKFYKLLGDR